MVSFWEQIFVRPKPRARWELSGSYMKFHLIKYIREGTNHDKTTKFKKRR